MVSTFTGAHNKVGFAVNNAFESGLTVMHRVFDTSPCGPVH